MDKVVPNAVDIRVDHQRVNESEDQHYPKGRVRVKEEESQEISEMKQARRSWDRVPARVREEPGICRGTLDADDVGRGHNFGELTNNVLWWKCDIWQALVGRQEATASQPSTAGISDPRSPSWSNLALPMSISYA